MKHDEGCLLVRGTPSPSHDSIATSSAARYTRDHRRLSAEPDDVASPSKPT